MVARSARQHAECVHMLLAVAGLVATHHLAALHDSRFLLSSLEL